MAICNIVIQRITRTWQLCIAIRVVFMQSYFRRRNYPVKDWMQQIGRGASITAPAKPYGHMQYCNSKNYPNLTIVDCHACRIRTPWYWRPYHERGWWSVSWPANPCGHMQYCNPKNYLNGTIVDCHACRIRTPWYWRPYHKHGWLSVNWSANPYGGAVVYRRLQDTADALSPAYVLH